MVYGGVHESGRVWGGSHHLKLVCTRSNQDPMINNVLNMMCLYEPFLNLSG